jgi:hypothetical protein
MRYREGPTPGALGEPMSDALGAGTAVYALVLGIGFVIAGWRFKQRWMIVWGAGLAGVSVGYLVLLGRS